MPVAPDPAIDGSMADGSTFEVRRGLRRESAGNLLGRPAVTQTLGHIAHQTPAVGLGPTQMGSPSHVGQGLGVAGIVAAVLVDVAFALAADGAWMPAQTAGDRGLRTGQPVESGDDNSFLPGK